MDPENSVKGVFHQEWGGGGGSPDNGSFLVIKVFPIISVSNFKIKNWEPQHEHGISFLRQNLSSGFPTK